MNAYLRGSTSACDSIAMDSSAISDRLTTTLLLALDVRGPTQGLVNPAFHREQEPQDIVLRLKLEGRGSVLSDLFADNRFGDLEIPAQPSLGSLRLL